MQFNQASDYTLDVTTFIEKVNALHGHTNEVRTVVFCPDGGKLISGSIDEIIRCWDVATGAYVATVQAPCPYDGMQIASATGLTASQLMSVAALGVVTEGE